MLDDSGKFLALPVKGENLLIAESALILEHLLLVAALNDELGRGKQGLLLIEEQLFSVGFVGLTQKGLSEVGHEKPACP